MKVNNLTVGQFIQCKTIADFETDTLNKSNYRIF